MLYCCWRCEAGKQTSRQVIGLPHPRGKMKLMCCTIRSIAWAAVLMVALLKAEDTRAANILGLFPISSRSHNNVYSTITRALAQRGHRFTVVTSQPLDSPPPNYQQIDVGHLVNHLIGFNDTKETGPLKLFSKLGDMIDDICGVLKYEKVHDLIKNGGEKNFDLIIMSNFFSECFYPFGHIYKVPIVMISPSGAMPSTYSAIGNFRLPSFYAEPLIGYSDTMNFKERLLNTMLFVGFSGFYKYYIQGKMEIVMREAFGEDTPSISELEQHVSLALLNNHFALNQARSTVPSMVEVGGLHIKPPKELPKDLKTYLDGAGKEGVLYFSLGSVLKSANLADEKRNAFVTAFSKLKQKVLWKWEGKSPIPGQSKNVRTEKWLPQQDVLAHPNVKAFMTHGGLLSFQEASNRGVPLIGIPHFADQQANMQRVADLQVGVKLDANNLTADNILSAINEVLGNPAYSKNMKKLQSIVADQKDDPLERAIYWIEYVMRHNGAKHLKPAVFYLHWTQAYMLDVLLVIAAVVSLVTISSLWILSKLLKKLCSCKGKEQKSEKKTQVFFYIRDLTLNSIESDNTFYSTATITLLMTATRIASLHKDMKAKRWLCNSALAILFIFLNVDFASSANILALFPVCSRSQTQVYTKITTSLAARGHSITVVTSQPLASPPQNYRQIDVLDIVAPHFNVFNVASDVGILESIGKLKKISVDVCRDVLQREEIKELKTYNGKKKFDLILISSFFGECYYSFAHIHDAPIVLISPGGPIGNTHVAVGTAPLPSYFAEPFIGYNDRMNLKERIVNTLGHFAFSLFYKNFFQRQLEQEMRAAFGEDTPSISELEERVSLVVLNHHFSLNQARTIVPCLVEAGGLHIEAPKELPKDLKDFLDGAGKEGAIYFSLGSHLRSSNFSKETTAELIAAFSSLKQTVLWKWEGDGPLPGQPENLKVEKWLPQQDVLAHPNVRLFITHGGLLSFQEAANRGVPLIGIPYYGDQVMNVNRMLDLKVGVKLEPKNITTSSLLDAIDQVLGNPEYAENMKRLQSIVTDQKDHPLDRAIYWIEYVLRHDGAKHLKPAAFYLHWSQICLLDVLSVIVVIPSILMVIFFLVLSKIIKKCRTSRRKVTNAEKKAQ
ncbi:uncharacterized protein LOC124168427 [Ischnura elegans]|uniref:uncharacterized protein LOC124168427 n=1 Tax=Ischnura elegans TaxID=197161 RepID=UPI001ED88AE1|nr:uncharacterized protein LOC124168427 [Ischnura elegans]